MNVPEESTVLSSWKDIARYLGKGVRTVQRWERQLGLPVRRPIGASQKSAVLLYRHDVDAWLATRFTARPPQHAGDVVARSGLVRLSLHEGLRRAQELRTKHSLLTEQIQDSIRQLTRRCELLSTQALQESRSPDFLAPVPESLAWPEELKSKGNA